MLDIKLIRENPNILRESLKNRNQDFSIVDELLKIDEKRRLALNQAEKMRAEQNSFNNQIADLKKQKKDAGALLEKLKELSKSVKELQEGAAQTESELHQKLLSIPNILSKFVPIGKDANQNEVVKTWGEKTQFSFKAKDHVELGESLGILDFERATKISGARFCILKGIAAKLDRALVNFFLDRNSKKGFEEILPPFIVNRNSATGTGQLPKFEADLFHIKEQDFFLVPTAEVPVTNIFAGEILKEEDLPIYFTAYTPCFRSEAGSYGVDTKGLIRQHQFNKVELVKFSHPDKSFEELESLRKASEELLEELELPYQTVKLCSGDIGFGASLCYDLEVWLPSQNKYREISSCSNFEDFQARRANIRYKDSKSGKPQFVHTLNGSALAVGRTLLAIMENYQMEDGRIRTPHALKGYLGTDIIG